MGFIKRSGRRNDSSMSDGPPPARVRHTAGSQGTKGEHVGEEGWLGYVVWSTKCSSENTDFRLTIKIVFHA